MAKANYYNSVLFLQAKSLSVKTVLQVLRNADASSVNKANLQLIAANSILNGDAYRQNSLIHRISSVKVRQEITHDSGEVSKEWRLTQSGRNKT